MRWKVSSGATKLSVGMLALILMSGCAETMAVGDKGCAAYGVARAEMPRGEPIPPGPWGLWIAVVDDRLTAACR